MFGFDTLALAFMIIGTLASAYGQYAAGQQAQAMYKYQSKMAERNAQISELQAKDAEKRGAIEEAQHRLKVQGMIGEQKSALAAGGVAVDTGSPLDILVDTAGLGEFDAQVIRRNASREAWAARTQAQGYRAEAGALKTAGNNAYTSGIVGAGGSLLTGASAVASKWNTLKLGSSGGFNVGGALGSSTGTGGGYNMGGGRVSGL